MVDYLDRSPARRHIAEAFGARAHPYRRRAVPTASDRLPRRTGHHRHRRLGRRPTAYAARTTKVVVHRERITAEEPRS